MLKRTAAVISILIFLLIKLGAETPTLLVYPFENQGPSDFDWLSQGMTSTALSDLSAVNDLKLISQTDRDKAMEELKLYLSGMLDEEKALEVGKWEGADYIFTGTYMVAGSRIRANAQILDVERGTVETSIKTDGSMEDIFDFQDRIILDLMTEAQRLRLGGIAWEQIARNTYQVQEEAIRPSLSAYELYSRGLGLRNENPVEALEYFRQALEQDPDYLDALIMTGHLEASKIRNYQAAAEYLRRAESILTSQREQDSYRYLNLMLALSKLYRSLGDTNRGREYLNKALVLKDKDPMLLAMHQGNFERELGNYTSALAHYDRALEALDGRQGFQPFRGAILLNKGITYNQQEDLSHALETFARGLGYLKENDRENLPLYAEFIFNRGNTYRYQGEMDQAIDAYENAVALYRSMGLENTSNFFIFLGNLGGLYGSYKKDWLQAAEILTEAVSRAENTGNTTHKDYGTYLFLAAYAWTLAGEMDQAGPLFRKGSDYYAAMDPNHPRGREMLIKAEELGY